MFLSNLRVKSPVTKKNRDKKFEGTTSIFQNIVSEQFKHNLNL